MTTIARKDAGNQIEVVAGVDTHQDTHTAAVIDTAGRLLKHRQFRADGAGYTALLAWLRSFGTVLVVGIEGTGAYGAGLARHLQAQGVSMAEIDRPDRKTRRSAGKSDPIDAEAAARAAFARVRTGVPKQRDGRVEALRNLRVARRSAVDQRADCMRQIKTLIITAPDDLRERLRGLPKRGLLNSCAGNGAGNCFATRWKPSSVSPRPAAGRSSWWMPTTPHSPIFSVRNGFKRTGVEGDLALYMKVSTAWKALAK